MFKETSTSWFSLEKSNLALKSICYVIHLLSHSREGERGSELAVWLDLLSPRAANVALSLIEVGGKPTTIYEENSATMPVIILGHQNNNISYASSLAPRMIRLIFFVTSIRGLVFID